MNEIEKEKRKRELFFEVTQVASPKLANPDFLEESDEIEDLFGKLLGFVAGGIIGALTGGTGWALMAAIAQGAATGLALGSLVDSLFSSAPDDPLEPQRLPDPTYSINSAGSESLAKKGQIIPLIYTSDLNPTGGVRYLGNLIYSNMTNENNSGELRQLYSLGYRGQGGTTDLESTLLINNRKANEILFLGTGGGDDELELRFISDNRVTPLNPPFSKEYSQAINPSQLQSFGYKFISQTDTDNKSFTTDNPFLPGAEGFDTNNNEINKFNVYLFSKSFVYGIYTHAGSHKFEQIKLNSIDTSKFRLKFNRAIHLSDRNKFLELNKMKFSTTKMVNKIVFNLDFTLFGKDLVPDGQSNQP